MRVQQDLDDDTLFRTAYIPFVLANVVWDYADTICNQAAAMRISETKPLSRQVRELNRDYEHFRAYGISSEFRAQENDHSIEMQDDWFKDYFEGFNRDIREHISYCFPRLSADSVIYVTSIYCCIIVSKAMFKYTAWADDILNKHYGRLGRSILPSHMKQLSALIPAFLGDCANAIADEDMQGYVDALVEQVQTLRFTTDAAEV
jgi:hypothetical protein